MGGAQDQDGAQWTPGGHVGGATAATMDGATTATLGGAHGGAARDSAVADGQCLRQTRGGPGRNSAVADDRGAGAFGAAAGLARA